MEQRLSLAPPAREVATLAVSFHLRDVTPHRDPSLDLAIVFFWHAPAHEVPAVPLEPSARIHRMNPALSTPLRKWLARVDAKEIE